MIIRFDAKLMEAVVFQEIARLERSGDSSLVIEYHSLLNPVYEIKEEAKREDGFLKTHRYFFNRMGWNEWLEGLVREFPLVTKSIAEIVIREEYSKKGESSELYVEKKEDMEKKNVVIQIQASRFLDRDNLASFFRHEFLHIEDMCDPCFAYSPYLNFGEISLAEESLIRERYRILWAISVDGRLTQQSKRPFETREKNYESLLRYFRFLGEEKVHELFYSLWADSKPTHARLLELARNPRWGKPLAGRPCPLCTFPTFDWFDASISSEEWVRQINQDFPHWQPFQGLCGQCAEIYRSKVRKFQKYEKQGC